MYAFTLDPAHRLTIEDVANEIVFHKDMVWRWIAAGLMPGEKFGRRFRINRVQWDDCKDGTWTPRTASEPTPITLIARRKSTSMPHLHLKKGNPLPRQGGSLARNLRCLRTVFGRLSEHWFRVLHQHIFNRRRRLQRLVNRALSSNLDQPFTLTVVEWPNQLNVALNAFNLL